MQKALLFLLCFCGAYPFHALCSDTEMEICASFSDTARLIMDARQHGVLMKDTMEDVSGSRIPEFDHIMQRITMLAYSSPLVSSEEEKTQEATEFSNKIYLSCMKR